MPKKLFKSTPIKTRPTLWFFAEKEDVQVLAGKQDTNVQFNQHFAVSTSGKSSPQQAIYNELQAAGVDINNFAQVAAYYNIQ